MVIVFVIAAITAIVSIFLGFLLAAACYAAAGGEKLTFNDMTVHKVYRTLFDMGLERDKALDIVNDLQNKGILFREREEEKQV